MLCVPHVRPKVTSTTVQILTPSFTTTKVQILTPEDRAPQVISKERERQENKNVIRYSVYLLYWYASTHTDAETLLLLLQYLQRGLPEVHRMLDVGNAVQHERFAQVWQLGDAYSNTEKLHVSVCVCVC